MKEMEEPERLDQEGFEAFSGRSGDGMSVVILSLLAFEADGGRQRYAEYGEAVAPLLEKVGGRIVFVGASDPPAAGRGRLGSGCVGRIPDSAGVPSTTVVRPKWFAGSWKARIFPALSGNWVWTAPPSVSAC